MKNIFKYIILPSLLLVIFIVSFVKFNIEAFNYELTWGGNKGKWIYSDSGYIYPNKSINFKAGDSLRYNGVTVTSGTGGGGIASSDNITFTGRDSTTDKWAFGDSVKAYKYFRADSLFTKNITPDDNKGLSWANTSSVKSTSGALYYTGGSHSFNTPYNTNVVSLDSINGLNLAYGNFTPASGNGLLWDANHKITYTSPTMTMRGNYWTFKTAVNNSTLLQLDSVIGMQLYSGVYIGNGSGLTSVDAITLKGQDTTKFARTDTLTTEGIKGIWNFWNTVRFYTTVTFDVSPVFSALVNFANGLTTTTIRASSTVTFDGDMVNTGWKKVGSGRNTYKYIKDTVLYVALTASPPYAGTTFTVNHGIANWKSIIQTNFLIHEDSLNLNILPNIYPTVSYQVPFVYTMVSTDSTKCNIFIPATSVSLFNDTATIFIKYTDYNR